VPGLSEELSAYRPTRPVELGKGLENFIDTALPDFTHLTVLLYLMRKARGPCTAGEIAEETGDPKKTIGDVLERFERLEMVQPSAGLFTRKYQLNRQGAKMDLVARLVKLYEHPQAHEAVLRRVLTPKSPRA
jgi:hypothetical protein